MTVSPPPTLLPSPLRLVLTDVVGADGSDQDAAAGSLAEPLAGAVAAELAARMGLTWRRFDGGGDPVTQLAALQAQGGAWLAPLPGDPGAWLGAAGRWADLLGAFRQPTALLVPGSSAEGGLAAATTALLERAGVPLVGLIQWGGPWRADRRRGEGLPWLGWVNPRGNDPALDPDDAAAAGLARVLLLRWQSLDQVEGQSGSAASRLS